MNLRYKVLIGNIIFAIVFYASAHLVTIIYNNTPAENIYVALGQAIKVLFYIMGYVFILPIWLIIYAISKIKKNKELANGSILSFTFSLCLILIFYFTLYT